MGAHEDLQPTPRKALVFGIVFVVLGVLGAVWPVESWGRLGIVVPSAFFAFIFLRAYARSRRPE